MPKASPIQTSFSGGEFSPFVQGRVDVERYKTGLETVLNYIPTLQGPLVRRPGTKYVANAKDPAKPPTLIPFQFSADQSYMLEFGDFYTRFFSNEGQLITSSTTFKITAFYGMPNRVAPFLFSSVRTSLTPRYTEGNMATSSVVTAGSILDLTTFYAYPDIPNIKYAQNADTLYLAHPSYPLFKFQRYGNTDWDLKPVIFQDGPYLPFNSYKSIADSTRITFTPSSAALPVLSTGPNYNIVGTGTGINGSIRLTTSSSHVYATGDKVFVESVGGTVEANNGTSNITATYWTISVPDQTHIDLLGSVFVNPIVGSTGRVYPALFEMTSIPGVWGDASTVIYQSSVVIAPRNIGLMLNGGTRFWGHIASVQNPSKATVAIGGEFLTNTSVISAWQLGVYSGVTGFPSAVTFHQDRLTLAGCRNAPQQIDMSMTGNYENFQASGSNLVIADDNAISIKLLSTESNPLRWIKSSPQGLLAGSASGEWQITPNSQNGALAPGNVNAAATSFFGSANLDAVQAGNAVLYIQGAYRKLREMNYFFQVGTFRSTDLSELSEHITIPGVQKLAVQRELLPLVWGLRTDGALISMTYNRDDQTIKAGWAKHTLGGQSDSGGTIPLVKSIGVISASSATFDQLWMAVQRRINGTSVVAVEFMTQPFGSATLQEDGYCLDGGATYDSPLNIASVSTGSSCTVTSPGHGLTNGDTVKIQDVVGISSSVVNADGVVIGTNNLVNDKTFVVGSSGFLSFCILDFNGNANNSTQFSPYVSGGRVRKLVSTISGLTWLKNEVVGVVADGGIHPDAIVNSAGVLALQFPAAKVQIGFRYNSDGSILRTEAGAAAGSSIGMLKRINRVAFLLHRIGDFSFGPDFARLLPCEFPRADQQQADVATPLFSGLTRDGIEAGYDFDDKLMWRQSSGLPGMVQSVTVMMDETDV